jgi:hypothetical protein
VKGQTKNQKVLRKKNKKREGFAKEKKPATFAMPSASQLVAQQSSQIYNEPLIIVALLRDSRQTKLCDPLNDSDIFHSSQSVFVLNTSQSLPYTEYRYRL